MIINGERAVAAYKKVAQVRDYCQTYALPGDGKRLSIEDFHKAVSAMYNVTITKAQVAFKGSYVRGLMERNHNIVKIRVRLDQEQDWKRFTAVKELCHVIIDEQEDWSTEAVDTIRDLLVEYTLDTGVEARRVMQSEALAEIAAIELMYPFECRCYDLPRVADGSTTIIKIAHHYGLPPVIVGRALSPTFHDALAVRIWDILSLQGAA